MYRIQDSNRLCLHAMVYEIFLLLGASIFVHMHALLAQTRSRALMPGYGPLWACVILTWKPATFVLSLYFASRFAFMTWGKTKLCQDTLQFTDNGKGPQVSACTYFHSTNDQLHVFQLQICLYDTKLDRFVSGSIATAGQWEGSTG